MARSFHPGEADVADANILIHPVTDALLLVNLQKAHLPDGSMPIEGAVQVIESCRRLCDVFGHSYGTVVSYPYGSVALASSYRLLPPGMSFLTVAQAEEWHAAWREDPVMHRPADLFSDSAGFAPDKLLDYLRTLAKCGKSQQLHADYAIAGTEHAEFVDGFSGLDGDPVIDAPFHLGDDPFCDAWSALRDRLGRNTEAVEELRSAGIRRVFVAGMPFATFAARTAMDAADLGFEAYLVEDATAGSMPRIQDLWQLRDDLQRRRVRIVKKRSLVSDDRAASAISRLMLED